MSPKKTAPKPTVDPKLEELASRIASLEARLARALADYQNLENRFGRESSSVIKFANASLLQKLITVRDHLEMATRTIPDQGLTMVLSQLDQILDEEGVKTIDASGTYDPSTMECQELVPGAKDQVVSVAQSGYRLHDRILRPARVIVGNGETLSSEPSPKAGSGQPGMSSSN